MTVAHQNSLMLHPLKCIVHLNDLVKPWNRRFKLNLVTPGFTSFYFLEKENDCCVFNFSCTHLHLNNWVKKMVKCHIQTNKMYVSSV